MKPEIKTEAKIPDHIEISNSREKSRSRPDFLTLSRLYCDQKLGYRQIAEMYHVSSYSAYSWLKKAGIQLRQRGKSPNQRRIRFTVPPELAEKLKLKT